MTKRSSPFGEIEQLFERMSRPFDTGDFPMAMTGGTPVDVVEHPETYEVAMDLPGYDREDVDLRLSGRTLRVSASRDLETTVEEEEEGVSYVRRERRSDTVERAVDLPDAVDEEGVSAKLTNGVLTVTLPKLVAGDESKPIDIE